jgi:D-beta-D-heptose 7-phosphate kinase/D-beta-D-heptose 1-phosphate adenosyltransferase
MNAKILSRQALSRRLRARKRKTVVFTNGCYDLVHAGHVTLLEKARRLGDLLVVGLNSDASVRKLKGPSRPLVDEKSRAKLLAALACVDFVTIFPEETPAELIRAIKPDILVKGGDYAAGQIVGRDDVKRVVRIPLVKGFSTTNLVKKILSAHGPQARP